MSGEKRPSCACGCVDLLALCDEIDAKAQAAWEDYSRWIEGRPSSPVPMSVPKLDTAKVREYLRGKESSTAGDPS